MTQDEIIEMAELAGFEMDDSGVLSPQVVWYIYHESLIKFAKLVAEKEREACAKVCDELIAPDIYRDTEVSMWDVTCMECANAIRARGQA